MAKNKTRRKTKKLNQQHLTLNAAIGIVGVLLLGFIYSFSQNASYTGVPIKVKFPENNSPQKLAVDFYDDNRLHDVKVEVLNGCGIKDVAGNNAILTLYPDTLVNNNQTIGNYELSWNAAKYPSGLYFIKMVANTLIKTKKIMLIK